MIRLITPQRVIELAFTNSETNEIGLIKDAIIEAAQLRWIKPMLGDDLWDLLETEYSSSYSASNQTLVNRLEAPLAFYVKAELIPDMSVNTTASGLVVLTGETYVPATDTQRGQIQDQSLVHANTLLEEVTRWIEKPANITNYPTYYDANNSENHKSRGGIVL